MNSFSVLLNLTHLQSQISNVLLSRHHLCHSPPGVPVAGQHLLVIYASSLRDGGIGQKGLCKSQRDNEVLSHCKMLSPQLSAFKFPLFRRAVGDLLPSAAAAPCPTRQVRAKVETVRLRNGSGDGRSIATSRRSSPRGRAGPAQPCPALEAARRLPGPRTLG